jgi:hypothetical protein
MENICSIIRDIGRHLVDEKLYKWARTAEIFKLHPSESFVSFVNQYFSGMRINFSKRFLGIHMPTGKNVFIRMENRKWLFLC